jgi:alpha-galactosidase
MPPLVYDRWIPSVLFLTHFFPDDPALSQRNSLCSLILGQSGIWGDLPALSKEGSDLISTVLTAYKKVRDDMTRVSLFLTGRVGGSPEIYEKILPTTGRGAVVFFAGAAGTYTYVTRQPVSGSTWTMSGVSVKSHVNGTAIIRATLEEGDACAVFFGV